MTDAMTCIDCDEPFARPPRAGFFTFMQTVFAVRRQRTQLAMLDEHQLHDLGLDRVTALAEAQRKLWDVPHHWRV